MPLKELNWRPITFQGVTFPVTLMGISILINTFNLEDDQDLGEWLWRLTVCCGVTKTAPAERCARCAQQTTDLMLEHRQRVLDDIQDCLAPHGLEAETIYRDWMMVLQRIAELSVAAGDNCLWSAPLHPDDPIQNASDARREMGYLIKSRPKPLKDE